MLLCHTSAGTLAAIARSRSSGRCPRVRVDQAATPGQHVPTSLGVGEAVEAAGQLSDRRQITIGDGAGMDRPEVGERLLELSDHLGLVRSRELLVGARGQRQDGRAVARPGVGRILALLELLPGEHPQRLEQPVAARADTRDHGGLDQTSDRLDDVGRRDVRSRADPLRIDQPEARGEHRRSPQHRLLSCPGAGRRTRRSRWTGSGGAHRGAAASRRGCRGGDRDERAVPRRAGWLLALRRARSPVASPSTAATTCAASAPSRHRCRSP
jgi:hypothetical protein